MALRVLVTRRILSFLRLFWRLPSYWHGGVRRAASAEPLKILALGDSLTAGYGLPRGEGFTDQLGRR